MYMECGEPRLIGGLFDINLILTVGAQSDARVLHKRKKEGRKE